jgi:hypothetical protein
MSLTPLERQMKSRARASHNHPLVMRSPAEKLSMPDGDAGVRDLRGASWTAADVLACARALAQIDQDLARAAQG